MTIGVPVTVVRVFCDEQGNHGNPLGVVMEGTKVWEDDRQAMAHILGYSETVFVDDAGEGRIKIYTPEVELPFAGHPVIGTGWLLHMEKFAARELLTPAGKVVLPHVDAERCVARARAECVRRGSSSSTTRPRRSTRSRSPRRPSATTGPGSTSRRGRCGRGRSCPRPGFPRTRRPARRR